MPAGASSSDLTVEDVKFQNRVSFAVAGWARRIAATLSGMVAFHHPSRGPGADVERSWRPRRAKTTIAIVPSRVRPRDAHVAARRQRRPARGQGRRAAHRTLTRDDLDRRYPARRRFHRRSQDGDGRQQHDRQVPRSVVYGRGRQARSRRRRGRGGADASRQGRALPDRRFACRRAAQGRRRRQGPGRARLQRRSARRQLARAGLPRQRRPHRSVALDAGRRPGAISDLEAVEKMVSGRRLSSRGRRARRGLRAVGEEIRGQDRREAGVRGYRRRTAFGFGRGADAAPDAGLHPERARLRCSRRRRRERGVRRLSALSHLGPAAGRRLRRPRGRRAGTPRTKCGARCSCRTGFSACSIAP